MPSPDAIDSLESDDVRLLVELGFMALSAGMTGEAETLFAAVRAARPKEEAGPLGLAMAALARGQAGRAVELLRALPPSDAAQTYLGMALAREGRTAEARRVLAGVSATALDPAFAELAAAALRELEQPTRP